MADIIKVRRSEVGSAIANMSIKPREGEPVYDFSNGKLYLGEGENASTLAQLDSSKKYMLRWDKVLIPNDKLEGNITNSKLAGGITNDKLAGGITSEKIGSGEIKEVNLDTDAVTTSKIRDNSVTLDKLAINHNEYPVTTIKEYIRSVAGDGVNATTATTASKLASGTVGGETVPVYFNAGVPKQCKSRAGGTAVTLNGSDKSGSTAGFYAPTSPPLTLNNNQFVQWKTSSGGYPGWQDVTTTDVKWKRSSYADNADKIKIGNKYYTAGFTEGVLHFDEV